MVYIIDCLYEKGSFGSQTLCVCRCLWVESDLV